MIDDGRYETVLLDREIFLYWIYLSNAVRRRNFVDKLLASSVKKRGELLWTREFRQGLVVLINNMLIEANYQSYVDRWLEWDS